MPLMNNSPAIDSANDVQLLFKLLQRVCRIDSAVTLEAFSFLCCWMKQGISSLFSVTNKTLENVESFKAFCLPSLMDVCDGFVLTRQNDVCPRAHVSFISKPVLVTKIYLNQCCCSCVFFLYPVSSQSETLWLTGYTTKEPKIMWLRRKKRTGLVSSARSSTSQQQDPVMHASLQDLRVSKMLGLDCHWI